MPETTLAADKARFLNGLERVRICSNVVHLGADERAHECHAVCNLFFSARLELNPPALAVSSNVAFDQFTRSETCAPFRDLKRAALLVLRGLRLLYLLKRFLVCFLRCSPVRND